MIKFVEFFSIVRVVIIKGEGVSLYWRVFYLELWNFLVNIVLYFLEIVNK